MGRPGGNPDVLKISPFKKGESFNPNGRPKGSKNMVTVLKEMMEKKITRVDAVSGAKQMMTVKEALVNEMLAIAMAGTKQEVRLKAVDMAFDRVLGKPLQTVETTDIPATPEAAFERLAELAMKEGLSVEQFAKREGIEIS